MKSRFQRYIPYKTELSASDFNDRASRSEWFARLRVAAPLELRDTPGGPVLRLQDGDEFFIKILSGSNPYAWVRLIPDGAGTWVDSDSSGTTSTYPAYESNGVTSVPANTIVRATKAGTEAYQLRFTY